MSKSRSEVSQIVFEKVATLLVEALERGTHSWPLPPPPIRDVDFPPVEPISPQELIEQGLGLLNVDRGMFEYKLNSVVDLVVPHRMNLTDDPYRVHKKWLQKRSDMVAERLIFSINTDWLARALDPYAPDSTRWWLSIALLNGLSTGPLGQPIHQGYHLLESIAIGQRPGTWHTQPEAGPQNVDWNPDAIIPRMTGVIAHEAGVEAARWMLSELETGNVDRRRLLIEWIRLLMERPQLIEPLGLSEVLTRLTADEDSQVAVQIARCLAKTIDYDRDTGHNLAKLLMARDDLMVRRAMADVLTRLFRRLTEDALPFFNQLKLDDDPDILAAVSSTSSDLRFIDTELWADNLLELSNHDLPIVRRNIVPSLRDYFETFPDDTRKLLPALWQDGDEVVRTRMRELLIKMSDISTQKFGSRITDLHGYGCDMAPLWQLMEARSSGASRAWIDWLNGEGEMPESTPKRNHVSTMEAPENLPELSDALETLDQELGFLD
tara:strand:+ start:3280 stop:4758 length:1479 start_codon:yes stop_codon:yes gene_type:complete